MNLIFRCKHIHLSADLVAKEAIVPVTLIGKNGVSLNFTALLDSGSDFVLLPIEVAEALELDFDRANPEPAKVYTGETITTAMSKLQMVIQRGNERLDLSCRCAIQLEKNRQHEHIIFGSSFFENVKVLFDYPHNRFQIKSP